MSSTTDNLISKNERAYLRRVTDGRTAVDRAYDIFGYIVVSTLTVLLAAFAVLLATADKSALDKVQFP